VIAKQILEVEDLCNTRPPDERSVMTYVAGFFHAFSSMGVCFSKSFVVYGLLIERLMDIELTLRSGRNGIEESRKIRRIYAVRLDKQE